MKNNKTFMLTQLALLTAIEVILTFTPLGFIMIPPVSITVLHIPVIVGAILTGKKGGAVLGGVFGICSVIKATTAAASPVDMAFSPFLASSVGGNAIASLIMAVGMRILLGFLCGVIFELLTKKGVNQNTSIVVSAVASSLVHTVTVLSCLAMFFSNLGVGFAVILTTVASLNGILEILSGGIVGLIVCKPLLKLKNR